MPALALDSGDLVTEGPVIVQMIADRVKDKGLAPARDSADRYKLLEWLNYITTVLHKNLGPLFSPVLTDDAKAFFARQSFAQKNWPRARSLMEELARRHPEQLQYQASLEAIAKAEAGK